MKKILSSFLLLGLCLIVFSSALASEKNSKGSDEINVNSVSKNVPGSNITVCVDARIELLSIIKILAGCHENGHKPYKTQYYKNAVEYFKNYKNHEAVKIFSLLYNSGFSYDAPATLMVALSQPPEIKLARAVDQETKERAISELVLNAFIEQMRDFSQKSDFMKFFNENKNYYERLAANYQSKTNIASLISNVENYYGVRQNSYNIVLAPILRRSGGYGARSKTEDGKLDTYNITGPESADTNEINFGDAEDIRYLVWHEFSHSFVNPITEKYNYEVNLYSGLFKPIEKAMEQNTYPSWETCVNEHLIRAITARLAAREISSKAYRESIINEKSRGFFYIEPLCEILEKYEKNREKYRNFEKFYSEIISLFKDLSTKDLGPDFYVNNFYEVGTINGVSDVISESFVLIVPTNEKDKKTQSGIVEFAKEYKDMFYKNASVLTDAEAIKTDLGRNSIIVFGTPEGNLWLAKNLKNMPAKFSERSITLKDKYEGDKLRFITAWPNPANPKRGVIIYTALKAENVININNIMHGPTDYVVADGEKVLANGNYEKNGKDWSVK